MASLTISYDAPPEVLQALRDGRQEGRWIRCKCPFCDPEGRKRRNLAVGERGWLCHSCHAELRTHAERAKIHLQFRTSGTAAADEQRRRALAIKIAEECSAIQAGDPVDTYLRVYRHLLPVEATWPNELRRHTKLWHRDTRREYCCMVAIVRDPSGMISGIHRTYLLDSGMRADNKNAPRNLQVSNAKLTLGDLQGHAVVLGDDPNADTICVAEGLESTLAFRMRLRLPALSGLSAVGVTNLRIPRWVRKIYIGPDLGDRGGPNGHGKHAGMKAALQLRERAIQERRALGERLVVELMPPPIGDRGDWADWAELVAKS